MLDLLDIYDEIHTTDIVIKEVEAGLDKGFQEAIMIRKLVEEKRIIVHKSKKHSHNKLAAFGLHKGELTMLLLSKEIDPDIVVVDDRTGIKAAKYLGFKVASTPFLMLKNLQMGKVSKDDLENKLQKLMGFGYHISPGLYVKILNLSKSMK